MLLTNNKKIIVRRFAVRKSLCWGNRQPTAADDRLDWTFCFVFWRSNLQRPGRSHSKLRLENWRHSVRAFGTSFERFLIFGDFGNTSSFDRWNCCVLIPTSRQAVLVIALHLNWCDFIFQHEIKISNSEEFRHTASWLQTLQHLIADMQDSPDIQVNDGWKSPPPGSISEFPDWVDWVILISLRAGMTSKKNHFEWRQSTQLWSSNNTNGFSYVGGFILKMMSVEVIV